MAEERKLHAVAGILWRNGRYLMAERPAGSIMAGYWEFPGGKIENGENPQQALFRELAEELGVACFEAGLWQTLSHRYPHGHVMLHLFNVTGFTGEPAPLEGQTLRWIEPASPPDLLYLPMNLAVVEALRGGRPLS